MKKTTAIILAGGMGSRMNSTTPKQYMLLKEHPLLSYSLKAFQISPYINDIILVTRAQDMDYCNKLVKDYKISKVNVIVEGGEERYQSVYCGLQKVKETTHNIMIHDGARPLISQGLIERAYKSLQTNSASIPALPVVDTIKIVDNTSIIDTPNRNMLFAVQTPQVFTANVLLLAYKEMLKNDKDHITDDAMIVERYTSEKVTIFEGEQINLKITNPMDIEIAELYLNGNQKKYRK